MTSMTIKNIPPDLHAKLRQRAKENGRSINSEAIYCLKRAVEAQRIDPEAFLARVDALRSRISLPPLTDEILRSARDGGRP